MARVMVAVAVPDVAAALQDDPVALVDVLSGLAAVDVIGSGRVCDDVAAHLPSDRGNCLLLHGFLTSLAARIEAGLA